MRSFSPAVTSLLGLADVATFSLVSFGVSHFASLPYDVELMGQPDTIYRTLGIDGGLVSIEPPRLSSDVDRAPYKIVIADPDYNFRTAFSQGVVGQRLIVRIGLFNTTSSAISGTGGPVNPDAPLLHVNDTFIAYSGFVDNHSYSVDFRDGFVHAIIEGSSPMGDLDAVKAHYTSRDYARMFNTADTTYDKIYAGSGELKFKWGKA